MVTKEELDKKVEQITEKFRFISEELESLWQEAHRKGLSEFASRIESVQFNGYANPTEFLADPEYGIFRLFYDILKENEELKRISKIDLKEYSRLENKVKLIKSIIEK